MPTLWWAYPFMNMNEIKIGDLVFDKNENFGIVITIDDHYISIFWNSEKTFCYDRSHLEQLVSKPGLWSHYAN
jgi:hypothetical protein